MDIRRRRHQAALRTVSSETIIDVKQVSLPHAAYQMSPLRAPQLFRSSTVLRGLTPDFLNAPKMEQPAWHPAIQYDRPATSPLAPNQPDAQTIKQESPMDLE